MQVASVHALMGAGPLLLAVPVAVAAGALSFFSPCCLPLVPGYLAYLGGLAGAEADRGNHLHGEGPAGVPEDASSGHCAIGNAGRGALLLDRGTAPARVRIAPDRPQRRRTTLAVSLFVLGFAVVFVSYGAAFGGLGFALQRHQAAVDRALGVLTIMLGLLFAGVATSLPGIRAATRTLRLPFRPAWGLTAAPALGALFGVGWTPCIGPTLATVLLLSSDAGTAGRGALLALAYALGLGLPFILVATAVQRMLTVVSLARRHASSIARVGGAFLITIGVLELTGAWGALIARLQGLVTGTTMPL